MASWETDSELQSRSAVTSKPFAEDGTSSRTAPLARRKSSSRRSMTPPPSASSPRLSTDRFDKRSSRDIANDESISILDPRRFTPTLHANLVSEILALKRDQEEKARQIDSLETTLHNTKTEHEQLQADFSTTSKESRSLKRQLALLEGGTSSALDELSRERDEAVDAITDTKKRLDAAQKKLRSQEDDSQRVHDQWAQEKDGWQDERRKYERKLHTAESRLKMVLHEIATVQAGQPGEKQGGPADNDESEPDESGRENDGGSIRTMSMTNSIRQSLVSGPGLQQGHSLADELNFEEDETDADGRESALSHHQSPKHTRTYSRDGPTRFSYHRKNMSLESLRRPGSVARNRVFANAAVLEVLEGEDGAEKEPQTKPLYVDSGVQYSPPPSPPSAASTARSDLALRSARSVEQDPTARGDSEVEANQRKKRVQASKPLIIEPTRTKEDNMVSKSAQTADMPLSPPKTPPSVSHQQHFLAATMANTATQTDPSLGLAPSSKLANTRLIPSPPPVPTISIQPPTSRPTTPREPRLPQYVKNFGCQVNLSSTVETTDASVQTEGIQVDKRLALLPSHLQPSAISSRPNSSSAPQAVEVKQGFAPDQEDLPPRNPKRLEGRHGSRELESPPQAGREAGAVLGESLMSFVGEEGPNKTKSSRIHRMSGFFNESDTQSSDDGNEFREADGSDSEFRTALSAPKPKRTSRSVARRGSFGVANEKPRMKMSVQSDTDLQGSLGPARRASNRKSFQKKLVTIPDEVAAPDAIGASGSRRSSAIRRAAIIQNGLVREQSRSRSPSIPEGRYPPYPIPARFSSRRSQIGSETPSDGQGSPTRYGSWHTRGSSRSSYQSQSIRKVRSAAALPRSHRYRRHGSRSPPPPLSPSTEAPGSPTLPPLPRNDITSPRMASTGRERAPPSYKRHRHQPSANTENTVNTNITTPTTETNASQSAGVVDAIAQTMVGEWMLKYVRRRKSFNVPESSGKDDSGNDRHKRWVWLAPYERAILWSSKQPSSGSALLGKAGRKLVIQSVLDVKDDNPPPKVMPTVFNRSILILTPQRALKFTAESAERHYLWLTALSFLAHSSQEVPEIIPSLQQVKQEAQLELEVPPPRVRRGGIRDSIRIAKGRAGSTKSGAPTIPSIPSGPPSRKGGPVEQDAPRLPAGHSRESSTKSAAEPPFVPRFSERSYPTVATHGRKRSNTGGHVAPPLSFRGFSGPAGAPSAQFNSTQSTPNTSVDTYGESSDIFAASQASSNTTWNMSPSGRTSEASSRPSNFFDAVGTMRMEAFISPLAQAGGEQEYDALGRSVRRRSKEIRRRHSRSRSRRRDSNGYRYGREQHRSGKGQWAEDEDYFVPDDPFKGF